MNSAFHYQSIIARAVIGTWLVFGVMSQAQSTEQEKPGARMNTEAQTQPQPINGGLNRDIIRRKAFKNTDSADTSYAPVLKVKPKGVQDGEAESASLPAVIPQPKYNGVEPDEID